MFFDSETDVKREGDTYKFPHNVSSPSSSLSKDASKEMMHCRSGRFGLVHAETVVERLFMHSIYIVSSDFGWLVII